MVLCAVYLILSLLFDDFLNSRARSGSQDSSHERFGQRVFETYIYDTMIQKVSLRSYHRWNSDSYDLIRVDEVRSHELARG